MDAEPATARRPRATKKFSSTVFADLSFAIASTSANTNTVQSLDTSFADPDTETLRRKLNELIQALRR